MVVAVLDNVRSAFNVGSIFRTADAAGVNRLHLCGITCWPPHPKLEKTSLGAHEHVEWHRHPTAVEAVAQIKAQGLPVVALETYHQATPLYEYAWPESVALLFGHEVVGVTDEALALCDGVVSIPMVGVKKSINVASAFAVVVYHLWQRRGGSP